MISIKEFLNPHKAPEPKHDLIDALTQMGRMLLDAVATYTVRGTDADLEDFRRKLNRLTRQMDTEQSPMTVLGITSDAVEALETYCERTAKYNREQRAERQSMVGMLTETVAELAGQSESAVGRLQSIEKELGRASELNDIRALKASLGESLQAVRAAAAHHRNTSAATVERLRAQIVVARAQAADEPRPPVHIPGDLDLAPEPFDALVESPPASFVAVVRLRRADHIASRFGESVRLRMLAMIGTQLKTMVGPTDRLLRWKGTSFVMFLNTRETVGQVRACLAQLVAILNQQYIEVGSKTSLLSIGADWVVFSQADHPTLEAVFTEVDAFLANTPQDGSATAVVSR
jgi:GGDEF domain-containing protein